MDLEILEVNQQPYYLPIKLYEVDIISREWGWKINVKIFGTLIKCFYLYTINQTEMKTKELLTIEFRYHDKPISDDFGGSESKTITIGIFDTLDKAIIEGNKAIDILSKSFQVRSDDKFRLHFIFGNPCRLVTNCCYSTNGISYFAKITKLTFDDLNDTIAETFKAFERYKEFKNS